MLRVVDAYETFRREKDRFPDEETLFDWLRQQPDGKYDVDALESLIHIRKHEQAINAMNIFWAAILIVDPQPDDVQLLRLRLENDDLHLHLATSIEEALRVLRNENITLVLSEYDLANKTTGFELLRTMKNDPEMRTIPFVFHAEPDTTLIKQALEAGAEDWYPKISNIEITAMKLERIAGRRHDNATAAGNGVQGSLAEMGLIEMVQILSQGGRSVQIVIERAQDHGELILHKGLVISAARGELVGEAAAYDILRWQDGRFQILPLKKPPTPNITTSTDNLILNSCLQEDIRYQQATHGHDQPAVSEQAG